MATHRDGNNLETLDDLTNLFLESGQQFNLDKIKFLDDKAGQSEELVRKWMQEKTLWTAQLPEILKKVGEEMGAEGRQKSAQILTEQFQKLHKESQKALDHLQMIENESLLKLVKHQLVELKLQMERSVRQSIEADPQWNEHLLSLLHQGYFQEQGTHEQMQNLDS